MEPDVNALRADWSEPTRFRFGAGRISELPGVCRGLGITRPLVVTDPGLADLAILRRAVQSCEANGLLPGLFSHLRPNPTLDHAQAAAQAFRDGGHDGIVGFGGGTALEVAKVAALLCGETAPPQTFAAAPGENPRVPGFGLLPPIVAVPTTGGSGAEARAYALITDPDGNRRRRRVLLHPGMLPTCVIADPVLTIGLPPALTAATGMNALVHNLEAYCALGFDPAADGMAAEGVRLLRRHLAEAVRDGNNLLARGMVLAAASLGGAATRKGLGAVQALTSPLIAVTEAHQGLVMAVITPYVLVHKRPAVEERITRLAAYLGLERPGFDAFLTCLLTLREELGIPHTLRDLGVTEERVADLVEEAANDPFARGNPVPVTVEAARSLYARALDGDLDGAGRR